MGFYRGRGNAGLPGQGGGVQDASRFRRRQAKEPKKGPPVAQVGFPADFFLKVRKDIGSKDILPVLIFFKEGDAGQIPEDEAGFQASRGEPSCSRVVPGGVFLVDQGVQDIPDRAAGQKVRSCRAQPPRGTSAEFARI